MKPKLIWKIMPAVIILASLAAIVLLFTKVTDFNDTTLSLILLLMVLIVAARLSLRYAVVTAFLNAFCLAYFMPPSNTFEVRDPENWVALTAFLVTAILGSRLSASARAEAALGLRRQREINVLLALSRQLFSLKRDENFSETIVHVLHRFSGATFVLLYLLDGERISIAGEGADLMRQPEELRTIVMSSEGTYSRDAERVVLGTGREPFGVMILRGARLSAESVQSIGGLVSFALESSGGARTQQNSAPAGASAAK